MTAAAIAVLAALLALAPAAHAEDPGTVLVPTGALWRYRDDGSDQGTAWRAAGFDDSGWAAGPAELGFGDGDEATVVPRARAATTTSTTTATERSTGTAARRTESPDPQCTAGWRSSESAGGCGLGAELAAALPLLAALRRRRAAG